MINKKKLRITEIAALSGLGISIIADIADFTSLSIIAIVLMFAGIIGNTFICHCPDCKMPLRGLNSFSSDPGYCPRCGNRIEFDE